MLPNRPRSVQDQSARRKECKNTIRNLTIPKELVKVKTILSPSWQSCFVISCFTNGRRSYVSKRHVIVGVDTEKRYHFRALITQHRNLHISELLLVRKQSGCTDFESKLAGIKSTSQDRESIRKRVVSRKSPHDIALFGSF